MTSFISQWPVSLAKACLLLGAVTPAVTAAAVDAHGTRGTGSLGGLARMPDGAFDAHYHIVDPSRYPLAADAAYTPGNYNVWDNVLFETALGGGVPGVVAHNALIQPSIYGTDNAALLDALEAYSPRRSRAVVAIDPNATSADLLQEYHRLGVRGVRVNLNHVATLPSAAEFQATLQSFADAVRGLPGWSLQMYVPLTLLAEVEAVFPTLGLPVVFDHLGRPDLSNVTTGAAYDPYHSIPGFPSLVRLLRNGQTWVKVSAPYRLAASSTDGNDNNNPQYPVLDPIIRELFRQAPDRLLYGSDWPHTQFEGLDIRPWTAHVLDLTGGNTKLRNNVFRDNAKALFGME